ncbi:hypothetical protein ACWEPM_32990 [Streptomyces sp. NPDC004244]
MSDTDTFPSDLVALQEEMHRLRAEYHAYLKGLPWSVEPLAGWARGERYSHRGDVPDSPGWTEEQKERVAAMEQRLRDLAAAVTLHPYWATVEKEKLVAARMLLKKQTRSDSPGPVEISEAA